MQQIKNIKIEQTTENELQNLQLNWKYYKLKHWRRINAFFTSKDITIVTPALFENLTEMMKENPEKLKVMVKTIVYGTGALYGFGLGLKTISLGMNAYAGYTKLAGKITEKQLLKKLLDSKKIFTSTVTGLSNIGKKEL